MGDPDIAAGSDVAHGIYTGAKSDVTVVARRDVLVSGSRIAAYDGGNVTVQSLDSNVDAGVGALGFVRVERVVVDPNTHEVESNVRAIPGSGILATSFPGSLNSVGNISVAAPRGDILANSGGIVQLTLNNSDGRDATVSLVAGSKDGNGQVTHVGKIDAGHSGVIGSNVKLEATGDITGVVIAKNNIDVSSLRNVTMTALASGGVTVNAGGNVSGTIVGISSVSASGGSIDAALLSANVSASGGVSSSQVGFSSTAVAGSTSQSQQQNETVKVNVTKAASALQVENDESKKNQAKPRLTRTTGRVTVILPDKPK